MHQLSAFQGQRSHFQILTLVFRRTRCTWYFLLSSLLSCRWPKDRKRASSLFFSLFFFLFCWHWRVLPFLPGLSPAGALWGDSDPSGGGEAYHPESQEPAPAPVWPTRLRVCPPHPGGQPPSNSPPLQQLQRAVPEQLGELGNTSPRLCQIRCNWWCMICLGGCVIFVLLFIYIYRKIDWLYGLYHHILRYKIHCVCGRVCACVHMCVI